MIAIIDYGAGNLFSLRSSLKMIGEDAIITGDPSDIKDSDRMILPGVGAFGDATDALKGKGLFDLIQEEARNGKPLLGICLGMQLLFEQSMEYGEHEGLGLVHGTVRPLSELLEDSGLTELKIPQIGWNSLHFSKDNIASDIKDRVFGSVEEGDYVYFVHSYYGDADPKELVATCDYGVPITAAVGNGNVVGCQFHPEKSGEVGLGILSAFAAM